MASETPNDQCNTQPLHQAATPTSPYARDQDFYLDSFILLIEDTLFKVPQFRLIDGSEVFRNMLSFPQSGSITEGTNDHAPIKLDGISKADFKAFIRVMYPRTLTDLDRVTKEQWLATLKLSTMWSFDVYRHLAIETLSGNRMTSLEKILYGRAYKVRKWLSDGYYELVYAENPFALDVALELGGQTAWLLMKLREQNSRFTGYNQAYERLYHPSTKKVSRADIEGVFSEELREVEE